MSPAKMAAEHTLRRHLGKGEKKEKRVILHPVGAAVSLPPHIPGGVPQRTYASRIRYGMILFSHIFWLLWLNFLRTSDFGKYPM